MTFTEAAAQVLRLVGKPLHYKEITDVAIEKNLLSHVGKSPEVTMGARLAALVKKGEKDNPLVRVKPGVFALREWDKALIEKGLADRTPALERIAAQLPSDEEVEEANDAADSERDSAPHAAHQELDEEFSPPDPEEQRRAGLAAEANALFEREDDDEEPIFGSADEEDDDEDEPRREGRRRRRRRRKGGRGGEEIGGEDDLPSYTVEDAPAGGIMLEEAERESSRGQRNGDGARDSATRDSAARDSGRHRGDHPRDQQRGESHRGESQRGEFQRGESHRGESHRGESHRGESHRGESQRGEQRKRVAFEEGAVGEALAKSLASLLETFDRKRGPVSAQSLADAARRQLKTDTELSLNSNTVSVIAELDNARRRRQGQRPRFRISGSRLSPVEWSLDQELVKLERELESVLGRYRAALQRSLGRSVQDLPQKAVGDLVILLLERLGFSGLEAVKRPGTHGAELHLMGEQRSIGGVVPTAIVVRRDGRELGRERVTELRGALHHYGQAAQGWLITTGQVLSGAREEAAATGATPVCLIDGQRLAQLCEEHGLLVAPWRLELSLLDVDLLETLRSA